MSRNHFRSWPPRSLKVSLRGNSVLPPLLVVATLGSAAVIDCTLDTTGSDSHSATTVVDYNPTVTATIATVYNTIIVVVTDLNTRIITVTPSVSSVPP